MKKRFFIVAMSCALFGLSACAMKPSPHGKPLPILTFDHLEKQPINVGMLRTLSAARGFSQAFIISPHAAMRDYMQARFIPKGFTGELQTVIEQANVKHSYELSTSRMGASLNIGGLDVYYMSIKIRLEHIGADKNILHSAVLNAKRVVKVSEHASIAQREMRQLQGAEGLFKDLDVQIRAIVLEQMRLGLPAR